MKAKTVSSILDFASSRDGLGVRTLLPFFFLPSPISAACKVALRRLHSVLHLIIELLSSLPTSVPPFHPLPLPPSPSPLLFAKLGLGWLARTRGGVAVFFGGLCLEDPITALNGFLDESFKSTTYGATLFSIFGHKTRHRKKYPRFWRHGWHPKQAQVRHLQRLHSFPAFFRAAECIPRVDAQRSPSSG